MLTHEQNKHFSEILRELGKTLDITPAQYEAAVKSYEFVGEWLSRPESPLAMYHPEILPQGSFLLGTMIRPIHEDIDLDIDLVCRLTGKKLSWTQADLKKIVGDRLKMHEMLKRMLDKEGRRCWTLVHRAEARFHMDVLPAIINEKFMVLLEKKISASDLSDVGDLAMRITDRFMSNYDYATDIIVWLKSNPFGYNLWFQLRAALEKQKLMSLNEAIQPVPDYPSKKLPLHIIVQILKRHRDILFKGADDKPISIIITTLAAKAYSNQIDLMEGLVSVVNTMEDYIEERLDNRGRRIKWISNPVNPEENFADKWPNEPKKQENFYKWLAQIKADLNNISNQLGLNNIQSSLGKAFGEREVNKAFSEIGENARKFRESGNMKMATGTGVIGSIGRTFIPQHTNYGGHE